MRAELRIRSLGELAIVLAVAGASPAAAQGAPDGPLLRARQVLPSASFKIWLPTGELRLVAWDRDSVVVRGRVARGESFYMAGDSTGFKFGAEPREGHESTGSSTLVAYVPRRGRVSVKTVTANVDAAGVSGWFYSVSGSLKLRGAASSIEAETMSGSLDLDVATPWLRARTGDGHLLLRGSPEDVDVSTVAGTLDVIGTSIQRGEFGSVSGDIHFAGAPSAGAIMEFSNHSGNVELMLPSNVSGVFSLSSISGAIENGFAAVRPAAAPPRSMRLRFGRGGSQVTVRTFKGEIRLRRQ